MLEKKFFKLRHLKILILLSLIVILSPVFSFASASYATRITDVTQLIPGKRAEGKIGDYLLYNEKIRIIIDDYNNPHGFAISGGNIIDVATSDGNDNFASMFTMFNNHFGRQAVYNNIQIVNSGGESQTAHIRCFGTDSEVPDISIITDYYLNPDDDYVTITTTLINNTSTMIYMMEVGDAIQWGATQHFAPLWPNLNRNVPGDGYDIGGVTLTVPWIAADGYGSAYGITKETGTMTVSNGAEWSDTIIDALTLNPNGGTGSYTRYFFVGDGSISSVSNKILEFRGSSVGTLRGTVTENQTNTPISQAKVIINSIACLGYTGSKSYTIAETDEFGNYSVKLEAGTYRVVFKAKGRTDSNCQVVTITANTITTLNQTMSKKGYLSWIVTEDGQPIPAKISVLYYPHTPRREGPNLGDNISLVGGYSILSPTGSGIAEVPPNDTRYPQYEVWISRGPEYSVHKQIITINEGQTTTIVAEINRVVDSTNYLCGDQHVHSENSADSSVTLDDRAREAACEGLEIIVNTDHDYITDMSSNIASTMMNNYVNAFPGDEISTNIWGHFQGYPLTLIPEEPRNGALSWKGLSPSQIFDWIKSDPKEPLVQINHPRARALGYFDIMSLNPITGLSNHPQWSEDFDAIEVYNGKRNYQIPQVLNDWYRLLNRGKIVTGLGNTDSHLIFSQEIGYPRNYVYVGTDYPPYCSEEVFKNALKEGKCFFTNGPFVEISVNGYPLGSLVTDTDSKVDLHVKIQAPLWITVDTLNIIINGEVFQCIPITSNNNIVRLDQTYSIDIYKDSWVAVEVKGGACETDSSNNCITPGCPGRLDPIIPPLYGTDPVCPYAHTNPIYIDFNNNGKFDPPGNMGYMIEPISATRPIDSNYQYRRLNEVVTVRGTVTCGSYTFDNTSNSIFFQDDSQNLSTHLSGGMAIYQSKLINPELSLGDIIEVTGTLSNYNGLLEMTNVSITKIGKGAVPNPKLVTISQINGSNGEEYEGMLVRINNITSMTGTWPSFGKNGILTITDSTGSMTLYIDSNTDCDGSSAPVPPFDLIGVISQYKTSPPYNSGFEIKPRQRKDFIENSSPLMIIHNPEAESITACSAIIKWYTNKPSSSIVEYGTTTNYGLVQTGQDGVTAHSVILEELSPNTTYHFRVISGSVTSEDYTFTTASGSIPSLLSGPHINFITTNKVQIIWATDIPSTSLINYGKTPLYGLTQSGPSNVTMHYVTITDLEPSTTYYFKIISESSACGGGTLLIDGLSFNTPSDINTPPEVSAKDSLIPFTIFKDGSLINFKFEYRGYDYKYHLYGVLTKSEMEDGNYLIKICDLKNNSLGSWMSDGNTYILWSVDSSLIPDANYIVVAEKNGVEGPYGLKSNGTYREKDNDKSAIIQIGCTNSPCTPISASIDSVSPSTTVIVGTQLTFSGSGSGEGPLTYEWDFHYDGVNFDVEATQATINYTYAETGNYIVALRVKDSCTNPSSQEAIATVEINVIAGTPKVVISQIYGGGGNSGATYKNDFIELFNSGTATQDLTGWSVQYASATGSTWLVTNLSGSIPPGGYYLIQEAAGSGGSQDLPTPDAIGNIAMSATTGKVLLCTTQTPQSGTCPTGSHIVDFVGYGSSANCYEGNGPAPAPSNTTSIKRNSNGCTDTNNNSSDFSTGTVTPRNSSSPRNNC